MEKITYKNSETGKQQQLLGFSKDQKKYQNCSFPLTWKGKDGNQSPRKRPGYQLPFSKGNPQLPFLPSRALMPLSAWVRWVGISVCGDEVVCGSRGGIASNVLGVGSYTFNLCWAWLVKKVCIYNDFWWSGFYFILFFKLFYCSITVVCFYPLPLPPTPAKPTSLPCFDPLPLVLSMCPL